jgi:hypothetical protein
MTGLRDTLELRFWAKVRRQDDCWEWRGSRNPRGYGKISNKGKLLGAHRVSYEIHKGQIPDGLEIDHLCRNRWCVNPDHLEAVSHAANLHRSPLTINSPRSRQDALRKRPRVHPKRIPAWPRVAGDVSNVTA